MQHVHVLHRAALAATLATTACVVVAAAGIGNVVIGGSAQTLNQVYAFAHPGGLMNPEAVTTVIFSDKPIDAAKMKANFKQMNNTSKLVDDASASIVQIDLDQAGTVTGAQARASAKAMAELSYSMYESKLSRNEPKHVAGYVRSSPDMADHDRQNDSYLDLTFDVDVDAALKP